MSKRITLPEAPDQRPARRGRGRPPKTFRPPEGQKLTHKGYYITEAQYQALKVKAAETEDGDFSGIVRAALDAYLRKELRQLKETAEENKK